MKDLTHYFVDTVKSSENSVEPASEGIEELTSTSRNVNQTSKKRGRVKIKISKSNRGKICSIINNKDDLIDKTPSPLSASSKKTNVLLENGANDTPKRSNDTNNVNDIVNNVLDTTINLDSSNECIFSLSKRNGMTCAPFKASVNESDKKDNVVETEREGSNAFHVLMTRDKHITPKSVSLKSLSPEEVAPVVKNNEEVKSKLRKNKEKLIALAEKRGYSKRKLAEKDEEAQIEAQLENKTKMFKHSNVQRYDQRQRISTPRGLHNYFNKISTQDKEKEKGQEKAVNDKQEEYNEADIEEKQEQVNKTKKNEKRSRKVLASIDDEQVINGKDDEEAQFQPKKPKWSMRINLQPSESKKITTDDEDSNDATSLSQSNNNRLQRKKSKIKEKVKIKEKKDERDIDEMEEVKVEEKSAVLKGDTSVELIDNGDIQVIETKVLKRPSNEKLAPLFIKKSKPDPEVIAARKLFLHSRSPEQEHKKLERKNVPPKATTLPFPTISHVTQTNAENIGITTYIDLKHSLKKSNTYIPVFDIEEFKSVTALDELVPIIKNELNDPIKLDPEEVIKEVEERCSDARELWSKISSLANKQHSEVTPKKRKRKRKSAEKAAASASEPNGSQYDVWTQKYRPLNTKEIVGNENAALKLKDWLTSWNPPTNKDDYSSSEEFYNSDTSRCSVFQSNQQVAVLLGPHGSGKTASVYAIAEELGYNVLEVNASSKRTGRKILKDLEEATKSHRVKNSDTKSAFQSSIADKKVQKNSLILFEDVDLIFDEDEGFISATYQLASNTKRPIVMTARDSCSYLSRMAPQQLRIQYRGSQGSRAVALLDLITLAEAGTRLPRPCLDKLLKNGDLRKALLQLQYILISGTPRSSMLPSDFREILWQDMRNYLYKPVVKLDKKRTKKKDKSSKDDKSSKEDQPSKNEKLESLNIINNLANDLDTISVISSLVDVDDRILNVSQLKFEPSLSLEENMHYYSSNDVRSKEIGQWLRDKTMFKYTSDVDEVDSKILKQLSLKKELNKGVDLALSQITMHTLDSRAMSTDYLSSARAICRAEDLKSSNNVKRGNRFFHYLHNFRLSSGSLKPSILAAACKAMQEKS